jgi:hypothetical protein
MSSEESACEKPPDETDELPFACVWEVGVSEAGDPDDWEHHHPRTTTPDDARKQAQRDSDLFDPIVYMCEGPFKPDDAQALAGVDDELIAEVFGHE